MHIPMMCKEKKIPCVEVPSKEELGVAAGLGLAAVAIAIIDMGDGKDILKEFN